MCELHPEEYSLLAKSLVGFVFFGTPHRGASGDKESGWSTVATIISAGIQDTENHEQRALEDEDSAFTDLSGGFARLSIVHHIPLFCFFEKPTEGKTLVQERSGTMAGFPSAALNANHSQLCRFSASDDSNYILVRDQLIGLVQGSASCIKSRRQCKLTAPSTEVLTDYDSPN